MARTGLRMMPTFPLPPLKFRTAGFPQYGCKAGLSDGAFPADWFAIVLRTLRCHRVSPALCQGRCACKHLRASGPPRSTPGALAPVRVILSRSIITYSAPSAPLAGTARFHRPAAYTRCLRCAGVPRRPTSGSELSRTIPSRHVVLYDSGRPAVACAQFLPRRRWPSPHDYGLGYSVIPQSVSRGGSFRSFTTVHFRYHLSSCLPP